MGDAQPTKSVRPPAEGERAARRGLVHQDRSSARLIYDALDAGKLDFVGLADTAAGAFDDLVLGIGGEVIAHQFKKALQPSTIGLKQLLLGRNAGIADFVHDFALLQAQFPKQRLRLRYLTNERAATHDRLVAGIPSSTADFLREREANPDRSLSEWRATAWAPLIDRLVATSRLAEPEFDAFWRAFELVLGAAAEPALGIGEDAARAQQIDELARAIAGLIADNPSTSRWTSAELLAALGWPDRRQLRFDHRFPVGAYVQRNAASEDRLAAAIAAHATGYVSLVGPPGTGKSTLLQRSVRTNAATRVLRYLAYVPGTAQGQGRGEADCFYDDLSSQFIAAGLKPLRYKNGTRLERQQAFEHLLAEAGQRHRDTGTRFIIVVDGLDHIPREERPEHSLLRALPRPETLPAGILFVLGTQRLNFDDIPSAVRREAAAEGRRTDMTPLDFEAVTAMASALGLPADIDRHALDRVGQGHPLVLRYLIEKLKHASPDERVSLLAGGFGFDGDLEAVYDAAWRAVEAAPLGAEIKRVLSLLAHAEGPIEPALLAKATSEAAIEATAGEIRHLLEVANGRWQMFHNSFRLFVKGKPIERFGEPDPVYAAGAVYRRLADLAAAAGPTSPQRWLRFRYLYLAGETAAALALAGRAYFARHYVDGRSAAAVRADIRDAYRALKVQPDPVKLFDMMLADDEVYRRATVMEQASQLVEAHLAVGDLAAAEAQLDDHYVEGQQWRVIDALLDAGAVERARLIFDANHPWAEDDRSLPRDRWTQRQSWAVRAVLFLDDDQLAAAVAGPAAPPEPRQQRRPRWGEPSREDIRRALATNVAFALARRQPDADVPALAAQWGVARGDRAALWIEAATGAADASHDGAALAKLRHASRLRGLQSIHVSWRLAACRLAGRLGDPVLARAFVADLTPASLVSMMSVDRYEQSEPAARRLVEIVARLTELSGRAPAPPAPEERLLRGAQTQAVAVGRLLGAVRSGRRVGDAEIVRIVGVALDFFATARPGAGDDPFMGTLMPRIARPIVEAGLAAARGRPGVAARVGAHYDALVAGDTARLRWWSELRRTVVAGLYRIDGDGERAAARLTQALSDLACDTPQEELDERCGFAIAYARIKRLDEARELLASLRGRALGYYLPAKKDGHYELLASLVASANAVDPAGRTSRAATLQRLMTGMAETEGRDAARRMGKQVLFEAAAAGPNEAWSAARWAASSRVYDWPSVIDATLRGRLAARPELARPILIAWTALVLPCYGEPYNGTTDTGQFLEDLATRAPVAALAELEALAVRALEVWSPPDEREALLVAFQRGLRARSLPATITATALARHRSAEAGHHERDPERRDYDGLATLEDVEQAFAAELDYRARHPDPGRIRDATYGLRIAAARVVRASSWSDAKAFAERMPALADEREVRRALASTAMRDGHSEAARALLPPPPKGEGGWGWPSDAGHLEWHRGQHLLGVPGAHAAALDDFLEGAASARYGVGALLWSITDLFPLFFKDVPWPRLWTALEAHLHEAREYREATLPPTDDSTVGDDGALMIELWRWAFGFGIIELDRHARRGALALAEAGETELFNRLVETLLAGSGDEPATAMLLLADARDLAPVAAHFAPRLAAIGESGDIALAWGARQLAKRWDAPMPPSDALLPAFYTIHMPPAVNAAGAIADERTQGMVVENPLAWVRGFEGEVRRLAEAAGVEESQIRYRVRQLIDAWGGLEAYGHPAAERLDCELRRLDLKRPFRRLHVRAGARALRHVVGELWRAGRLDEPEVTLLLHRLGGDADRPRPPVPTVRPSNIVWPELPEMLWGEKRTAWIDGVGEDVDAPAGDARVLAEWWQQGRREYRETIEVERWRGRGDLGVEPDDRLSDALARLPIALTIDGITPLYGPEEMSAEHVARLMPCVMTEGVAPLLILCPYVARRLGWRWSADEPHVFCDSRGAEMARTVVWADGNERSQGTPGRVAQGQRIVFSNAGLKQYEAMFGTLEVRAVAWRAVEASLDDGGAVSAIASAFDEASTDDEPGLEVVSEQRR